MKTNTVAIVLARGGSKGIPGKNIMNFCGKPLLAWTVEQCKTAAGIDSVWVSSDSAEILEIGAAAGGTPLQRPEAIAGDTATSESGWLHAIHEIERQAGKISIVVAPQVTSPLRHASDFSKGVETFKAGGFDSLFSCSVAEDLYFWERQADGKLESINYDWRNRKRRQDHTPQLIENGSFYIFTPEVLQKHNNRFGQNIGVSEMEFWKLFEIDSLDSFRLCEAIMKNFILS